MSSSSIHRQLQDDYGQHLSGSFSRRRRYVRSPERQVPVQSSHMRRSPRDLPPINYSVVGRVMHQGQSWIAEQYDAPDEREQKIPYTASTGRPPSKRSAPT